MSIYTDSKMVQKSVDWILQATGGNQLQIRQRLKRVRNYQSQWEIGSPRYEFWKSVGDKLQKEIL
jgi:hypothetical protein